MNIDHDHPVTADPVHTPWCERAHPDTDDGTGATPCTSRPVMLWPGAAGWLRSATYPADAPVVIVDNRDGTQSTWALAEFRQMLWAGLELCATANLGTWPAPDPGPAPHTELTQAEIEAQADAYARNTISPEFADALLSRPPRVRPRVDLRLRLEDAEPNPLLDTLDLVKTSDRGIETMDEFERRGGQLIDPAAISFPKSEAFARGEWHLGENGDVVLESDAGPALAPAERAAAAIPVTLPPPVEVPFDLPPARPPLGLCTCSFLPDPHIWGAACPAPPAGGQA